MANQMFDQSPNQGSAFADAAQWLVGLLTGSIGTSIAVLAMAGVGLAMLQGRVSARDALRVVLGCFILFGAPAIAQGLAGIGRWNSGPVAIPTPVAPPSFTPPPAPKANPDPYAGASMPM